MSPIIGFDFFPRTRVIFGLNSIERLGDLARELSAEKALLVTDAGLVQIDHADVVVLADQHVTGVEVLVDRDPRLGDRTQGRSPAVGQLARPRHQLGMMLTDHRRPLPSRRHLAIEIHPARQRHGAGVQPGQPARGPARPGRRTVEIKAVALDDYVAPGQRVDFIKMDIQGAELSAVRGARRLLSRPDAPTLLFEYWPYGLHAAGHEPRSLLAELESLGYRLSTIAAAPWPEPGDIAFGVDVNVVATPSHLARAAEPR